MGDIEEVRKGLFSVAHRLFNAVDGDDDDGGVPLFLYLAHGNAYSDLYFQFSSCVMELLEIRFHFHLTFISLIFVFSLYLLVLTELLEIHPPPPLAALPDLNPDSFILIIIIIVIIIVIVFVVIVITHNPKHFPNFDYSNPRRHHNFSSMVGSPLAISRILNTWAVMRFSTFNLENPEILFCKRNPLVL